MAGRTPPGGGWELLKGEASSASSDEAEDLQTLMLTKDTRHFADLAPSPAQREPWTQHPANVRLLHPPSHEC